MPQFIDQSNPHLVSRVSKGFPLFTILVFACLPALATWSSFYLEIFPFLLYPLSKAILFALPFIVWRLREKGWRAGFGRMAIRLPTWRGVASGAALSCVIYLAFVLFFSDLDSSGIRHKLISLGILEHYWSVAFFILAINSAFEEWFWRGFLLDEFRIRVKQPAVIIGLGGLFFGFHHYFTLLPYFPLGLTLFFTFATMVAGGIWSMHRLQGWSLADCYVSHLCADLAVLCVGATLLF